MPQVFPRPAVLLIRLGMLGAALLSAVLIVLLAWRIDAQPPRDDALRQPIAFSHKHHVGDDGIDCRYCHTTVETSAHAGLPTTQICLSCHSQLYRDQPALAMLRQSAASGRPIAWQRVHDLPDFVYFDHSVHVAKGVPCAECHGRVDQMPRIRRVAPLQMQWCLSCHRDPAPHLRTANAVFAPDPDAIPHSHLHAGFDLETRRRLTDCSTCHR